MKVNLDIITEAFEMIDDNSVIYFDLDKNEIGFIFDADSVSLDTELENLIPENAILLPSQFDINEYIMMEDFILTLEENDMTEELTFSIKGRGAFRNFKHLIHRYDIQERWYNFKHDAYILLAKEWCTDNGIEYDV